MSTKPNTDAEEKTNEWHSLPGLIGEMITTDVEGGIASGGYLVVRDSEDTISIYREIDVAGTVDDLETEGDLMWDFYDHVTGNKLIASIEAPEDGWDSETTEVTDSIWGGWE